MNQHILFSFLGGDRRMRWAEAELQAAGYATASFPPPGCTHIVLPLPAFRDGKITGGPELSALLPQLHQGITLLGGKLEAYRDALEATGARVIDYYTHEPLVAANARLTAEAAIHLGASRLPVSLEGSRVLVCGWGRIGQLLAHKLQAMGAAVTASARAPRDLALIEAFGFTAEVTGAWKNLEQYTIIYNTIPVSVFTEAQMRAAAPDCLFIELASGFAPCAERTVLPAPGLPGIYAPETAGRLIGRSILTLCHLERRSPWNTKP